MLEALLETGLPVRVVTNAHTDLVDAKLNALAPRGGVDRSLRAILPRLRD